MELLRLPLADGDYAESLLGRVCLVITQRIVVLSHRFHWHLRFHDEGRENKRRWKRSDFFKFAGS